MASAADSAPQNQSPFEPPQTTLNVGVGGSRDAGTTAVDTLYFEREDLDDAPFWVEVAAFNQIPQPTIDEYQGKYVAVYQGNIVDADVDEAELALRFYRTFGYVPVYIHKVGVEDGLVDPDELS